MIDAVTEESAKLRADARFSLSDYLKKTVVFS